MGKTIGELHDISYSTLNQLYPTITRIRVGPYQGFVGGVDSQWSAFNEKDEKGSYKEPMRIVDSTFFANFHADTPIANEPDSPWKIHISIAPDDLEKAWDLVYPILIDNNVPNFKVTRRIVGETLHDVMLLADSEFLRTRSISREDKDLALQDILRVSKGMQITIYIPENQEAAYNKLLKTIEPILYKAGVKPGIIDKSDRALGLYSSVRHVGHGYTSYEKVTGYKRVEEKDPFEAIEPVWKDVAINWKSLDFLGQAQRAKLLLQQVLDAEKQYRNGSITIKEFKQLCKVAKEYFTRWHLLLKRTDTKTLTASELRGFNRLQKWIDNGYRLLPTLRKQKARKIREAEDILLNASFESSQPVKPMRKRLQRTDGQVNLFAGQAAPSSQPEHASEPPKPSEPLVLLQPEEFRPSSDEEHSDSDKKLDSTAVIQELLAERRKSFNLMRQELELEKEQACQEQGVVISSVPEQADKGFIKGVIIGGLIGAGLAVLCFYLMPLLVAIALTGFLLVGGAIIGGVVDYNLPSSTEKMTEETEPLLGPSETLLNKAQSPLRPALSKTVSLTGSLRRAGTLRMFDFEESSELDAPGSGQDLSIRNAQKLPS
ncbi:hypothetical protein BN59_03152 [Legionella massiliensis]|uniref:Uncharacterized protein n=1 Tax=Legionella massiliensis TaxID=1034943 RepID=A0A078L4I8_9GAMM|nr:phage holin family protein [Legionella massiliensis]CDZ78838.1 hypothetical protein BN59_03152 [Legionella massiliensis]CEE14576.1 hypothetical protein BN1094_03152 [Legionella massiliensis]